MAAQGDRVQDANHRRVQVSDPSVHRQVYDPAAAPNPAMQNAAIQPGGGNQVRAPSSDRRPAGQQRDDKGKGKGDKGKGKGRKKGGKDRGKGRGKGSDRPPKGGGKKGLNVDANARAQRSPGRTEQQHRAASPRRAAKPQGSRGRRQIAHAVASSMNPYSVATPTHLRLRFDRFLLPHGPAVSIWNYLSWADLVELRCSHTKKQCLLSSCLSTHTHLGRLFERAPIAEWALGRGARQTCDTPFDTASRGHRADPPVRDEFRVSGDVEASRHARSSNPPSSRDERGGEASSRRAPLREQHWDADARGNLCRHRDSRSQRQRLPYLCTIFV